MPWTGLSRYTQMPHIPAARIHLAAVSSRSIHPIHMHMRTTRLTRLGLDLMTPTLPCCPFRLPSRDTDGTVRAQTVLSPFPPIHTDGKRSFVRLSYLWLRLLGSFAWRCPARLCPVLSCPALGPQHTYEFDVARQKRPPIWGPALGRAHVRRILNRPRRFSIGEHTYAVMTHRRYFQLVLTTLTGGR